MAKSKVVNVPAREVRKAFSEGRFTATEAALPSLLGRNLNGERVRGRLHPDAVEAFTAEVGAVYVEKVAEAKTITLPVVKVNKAGARRKAPVDVTLAEFRRLSGTTKGRPSAKALEVAAANYSKEQAKA